MGEEPPDEVTEALLSEPLTCQSHTLKVRLGPDAAFWEQAKDYDSGKRAKTKQKLLLEFSRPPNEGEDCIEDTEGGFNIICLKSDERVAEPEQCPEHPEYLTALEQKRLEVENLGAIERVRALRGLAGEYFQRINRCMHGILPEQVQDQLTITARVPTLGGEKIACNDPRVTEVAQEDYVTHSMPVKVQDYLGMGLHAIVYPEEEYLSDCLYTLELGKGAFTEAGWCLAPQEGAEEGREGFVTTFYVAPDERSPFERETHRRVYDPETGVLRAFSILPGFTVSLSEFLPRYAKDLKLRSGLPHSPDKLFAEDDPRSANLQEGISSQFLQQYYKNIPVMGGGYTVNLSKGLVTDVFGKFIPGLNIDTLPVLPRLEAVGLAMAQVPAEIYAPATIELTADEIESPDSPSNLVITSSKQGSLSPEDYRLAWRFRIISKKPFQDTTILIAADNVTGEVLNSYSNIMGNQYIYPEGFNIRGLGEADGSQSRLAITAYTYYDGAVENFQIVETLLGEHTFYVITDIVNGIYTFFHDSFDEYGKMDLLFFVDGEINDEAGSNVWDTDLQKAAVSLQWAIDKFILFVTNLDSSGGDLLSGLLSELPVSQKDFTAVLSANLDHMMRPMAWYVPKEANDGEDLMVFNFNKAGYEPAVSPDIVGHELYHWYVARKQPNLLENGQWSDALEGFADVLGIILKCYIREGECSWRYAEDTRPDHREFWDISNPANAGFPDAYGGETYRQFLENCPDDPTFQVHAGCERPIDAYLVGRVFYLLSRGQPTSGINDLGCAYEIEPRNTDPKFARELVAETILALANLDGFGNNYDLMSARQATLTYWTQKAGGFSPDNIAKAWYSVGVGDKLADLDRAVVPEEGMKGVEPWPAKIVAPVPAHGQYVLQVSSARDFSEDMQEYYMESSSHAESAEPFITAELNVQSGQPVFWRFQIGGPVRPEEDWNHCGKTYRFTTASKAPEIIGPKKKAIPGLGPGVTAEATIPEVDPWKAIFSFHPVEGASEYEVMVSSHPKAYCPRDEERAKSKFERKYPATGSLDPIFAELKLEADRDYYYFIAAKKVFEDQDGNEKEFYECTLENDEGIPFKTRDPVANLIGPKNGSMMGNQGVILSWQAVPGARAYHVQLANDEGFTDMEREEMEVTGTSLDLGDIPYNPYYWRVRALPPEGLETPGSWSEVAHFQTLPVPVPIRPGSANIPNEARGTNPVEFVWEHLPAGESFQINLYQNNGGSPGAMMPNFPVMLGLGDINSNQVGQVAPILVDDPNRGYCWSVQARVAGSMGPESDILCYNLEGCQAVAQAPTSTENLETEKEYNPARFAWSCDGAEDQEFIVKVVSGDRASIVDAPAIAEHRTSERSWQTVLQPDTEYKWMVYPVLGDNRVSMQAWGKFKTKEGPEPEEEEEEPAEGCQDLSNLEPNITSPAPGVWNVGSIYLPTCIDSETRFNWQEISGATSYQIKVSDWTPNLTGQAQWSNLGTYNISQSETRPVLSVNHQGHGPSFSWCVQAKNSCSTSRMACVSHLMLDSAGQCVQR